MAAYEKTLEKFNLRELKAEVDKMKIITEAMGDDNTQQKVTPGQKTHQEDSTQEEPDDSPEEDEGPTWLTNIKARRQRANDK